MLEEHEPILTEGARQALSEIAGNILLVADKVGNLHPNIPFLENAVGFIDWAIKELEAAHNIAPVPVVKKEAPATVKVPGLWKVERITYKPGDTDAMAKTNVTSDDIHTIRLHVHEHVYGRVDYMCVITDKQGSMAPGGKSQLVALVTSDIAGNGEWIDGWEWHRDHALAAHCWRGYRLTKKGSSAAAKKDSGAEAMFVGTADALKKEGPEAAYIPTFSGISGKTTLDLIEEAIDLMGGEQPSQASMDSKISKKMQKLAQTMQKVEALKAVTVEIDYGVYELTDKQGVAFTDGPFPGKVEDLPEGITQEMLAEALAEIEKNPNLVV